MGFNDTDYYTARAALEKLFYNGRDRSDSQMYKMAGNSIVVNVAEAIIKSLLVDSYGEGELSEAVLNTLIYLLYKTKRIS